VLPGALLLVALAGCGTEAAQPVATVPPHSNTHAVIVAHPGGPPDSLYIPTPIRVHVGQAITWTNYDTDPHDVTSDSGLFGSGPIPQNGSWTWVPLRPGTYKYTCTLHPDMHGEVIVTR